MQRAHLPASNTKHQPGVLHFDNHDFFTCAQHGAADNFYRPDFADWIARLDAAIATSPEPPVLVAHSLSCALVAHWSVQQNHAIAGALLVAPADVDSDAHTPPETRAFRPMPMATLPFHSIVIASSDDPYVDRNRAAAFATAWGSRFVDIGAAGHINTGSGFGAWPLGRLLLDELCAASAASG